MIGLFIIKRLKYLHFKITQNSEVLLGNNNNNNKNLDKTINQNQWEKNNSDNWRGKKDPTA